MSTGEVGVRDEMDSSEFANATSSGLLVGGGGRGCVVFWSGGRCPDDPLLSRGKGLRKAGLLSSRERWYLTLTSGEAVSEFRGMLSVVSPPVVSTAAVWGCRTGPVWSAGGSTATLACGDGDGKSNCSSVRGGGVDVMTSDGGFRSAGEVASTAFHLEELHANLESEVAAGFVDPVCDIWPVPKTGSEVRESNSKPVFILKTGSGMAEAEDDGIGFASKTGSGVADSDKGERFIPKIISVEGCLPKAGSAETCIEFLLSGVVVGGPEVKGMMLERGRTL